MIDSKVNLDELQNIEGFSHKAQLAFVDYFCRMIEPERVLEIGLYKGRTAAILASYSKMFWGIEQLEENCKATEEVVKKYATAEDFQIHIENNPSYDSELFQCNIRSFSLIHIDGSHAGEDVLSDLELASKVLTERGIILLDDFFYEAYPQITEATYTFLSTHREFMLLAVGSNKGVIIRRKRYEVYANIIISTAAKEMNNYNIGLGNYTVARTSALADCMTLGIAASFSSYPISGNESKNPKKLFEAIVNLKVE